MSERKRKISQIFELAVFILIACMVSFSSCEIGLGSAVDTQPPLVTITYPSVDSVIREDFLMSGTASDETSVASVSVSLENINTGAVYGPYTGAIESENKWTCSVNQKVDGKYPIPDGSYEAHVTATDSDGKTTVTNKTYTIDNTAPVLIIQNPSTKVDENDTIGNTNLYGTKLKVVGQLADTNSVDVLTFTVYDKDTLDVLATTTEESIAQNVDIVLGDFELDDIYKTIYGDSYSSKKDFLFKVSVSDEARIYKDPKAAGNPAELGNTTTEYYLRNDIYTSVLKTYSVNTKDLYSIMSGTYSNTTTATAVKEALATKKVVSNDSITVDASVSETRPKGTFSLDPNNAPTYVVQTIEPFKNGGTFYADKNSRSKTDVLIISLKEGLGESPFTADKAGETFGITLYKLNNDTNYTRSGSSVVYMTKKGEGTTDAKRAEIIDIDNYELTVSLEDIKSNLTSEALYEIVLTGSDDDAADFDNGSSRYIFKVSSGSIPPDLSVTTPASTMMYVKKGADAVLSGSAASNSGTDSLTITGYLNRDEDHAISGSYSNGAWSLTIPSTKFNQDLTDEYSLTVKALDNQGLSTTKNITIYYDVEAPTVEMEALPLVTANDKENNVNGTITVKVTVTDDDSFSTGSWSAKISNVEKLRGDLVKASSSFTIDTTTLTDNSDLVITVTASDRAGQSTTKTETVHINQSTDKPVVILKNADASITTEAGIVGSDNIFDNSSNNKLMIEVTDDDGIAKIEYKYDGVAQTPITVSNKTTTSQTLVLPTTEGAHKVEIIAYDNNTTAVTQTTGVFYVAVDAAAPSLAITSPAEGAFVSSSYVFSGTASDGSGEVEVYSVKGATENLVATLTGATTSKSWTETVNVGTTTGDYERIYRAKDKYGRTQDAKVTYTVDKDGPSITVTNPANDSYAKKENSLQLSGTATDTQAVEGVYYKLIPDATTTPTTIDDSWTKASGAASWNANLSLTDKAEGKYKLCFASKDTAGNISSVTVRTLYIDESEPVLAITQESPQYVKGVSGDKISGTATDTYFNSLTWTRTGTVAGSGTITRSNPTTGAWSLDLSAVVAGTYSYTFTLTDKAGRTTAKNFTVVVDKTAPDVTITTVSPTVEANSKINVNGSVTVSGTIVEANTIASATYTLLKGGVAISGYSEISLGELPVSFNFVIDTTAAAFTDNSELTIRVVATDKAGNTTTVNKAVFIDQSTDNPKATYTNINATGTATENLLGMGSVAIIGTLTDDDGLASAKVKIDDGEPVDLGETLNGTTSKPLSYNISTLAEGVHTVAFVLTDINGKTVTTDTVNFAIDNNTPALTITTASNEYKPASTSVTLEGTAGDSSGFTSITCNGVAVGLGTGEALTDTEVNWTSSITTNANDGTYSVTVVATDKYGRIATSVYKYKVDKSAPAVDVTTYPSSDYVNLPDSPIYRVQGTASDSGSGLSDVRYAIVSGSGSAPAESVVTGSDGLGYWISCDGLTSWKANVDTASLTRGTYTFYVMARDDAGNKTTTTGKTLYVDTSYPTITYTEPDQTSYNANFTLQGSASDEDGYLDSVSATCNGAAIANTGSTAAWKFVVPVTTYLDGNYEVKIVAADKSGKQTVRTFAFGKDATTPTVTLTNINEDGSTSLTQSTPQVLGVLTDISGIQSATVYMQKNNGSGTYTKVGSTVNVPGFTAGVTMLNFTMDLNSMLGASLTDGEWQAVFVVKDIPGNTLNYTSKSFSVDKTDPALVVSGIKKTGESDYVKTYVSTGSSYTASGTISDVGGMGTVKIQLLLNNQNVLINGSSEATATISGNTWSCDLGSPFTTSGSYRLVVVAKDKAGRVKEDNSKSYLADTEAPEIVFVNPYSASVADGDKATLIGDVTIAGKSNDDALAYTAYVIGGTLTNGVVTKREAGTVISWENFDGAYNWSKNITTTSLANAELAEQVGDSSIWFIPFHVKAVDSSGNVSYATLRVKIDTDADKPTVEFTNPKDGDSVGGLFQATGSAEDNTNVYATYMQIEVVGAIYDGDILTKFSGSQEDGGAYNDGTGTSDTGTTTYFTNKSYWYKTSGSWSQQINKAGEFNKETLKDAGVTFTAEEEARENSATTTLLKIRIMARDTKAVGSISSDAVFGYSKEITVKVQSGAPSIVETNMPTPNTYVSGTVPINFVVTDDEGINDLVINLGGTKVSISASQAKAGTTVNGFTVAATDVNTEHTEYYKTWTVTGSYNTTSVTGSAAITIQANDYASNGNSKTGTNTRTIYIDNTAPAISEVGEAEGVYVMDGDGRGSPAEKIDMMGTSSEISGKALDSGSGISKVILYFTNLDGTKIYTMGGTSADGVGVDTTGTTLSTSITIGGESVPFPESSLANIKTGKTSGVAQKYIVIDKQEGGNDTGDVGDGDGYNEHLGLDGSWYVRLNSNNVKDGNYKLYYVAIDTAGNISYIKDNVLVANNAPKITGVKLYTDRNINGTIDDSEYELYTPVAVQTTDPSSGATIISSYNPLNTDFVVRNSKFRIEVITEVQNSGTKFTMTSPTGTTVGDVAISGTTGTWNPSSYGNDSSGTNDQTFTVKVEDAIGLSSKLLTMNVTYHNTDIVKPTVEFYELEASTWDSTAGTGSIGTDGGHIELRDDSVYNNTTKDPDVSGTIVLRGKAFDDQRLTSVALNLDGTSVTLMTWNASQNKMVAATGVTILSEELALTGHTVEWAYTWDTSTISTVAKNNVVTTASATDHKANASVTNTFTNSTVVGTDSYNSMTCDVVPYITSIKTPTRNQSGLKNDNIRSSSGKYSIIKGTNATFIQVAGYNLKANSVRIVNASTVASATVSSGVALAYTNGAAPYTTLSLSNAATKSGYLEVFVNGIRALNNINDNSVTYNQEPNATTKNKLLTDDRYLRFFDMKDTGIKNAYYPDMLMNGNNPVFGYVDLNGKNSSINETNLTNPYVASNYMPQRAEFSATTGKTTNIEYLIGGLTWSQMSLAKDDANKFIQATVYDYDGAHISLIYNKYAEQHTWNWGSYTDGWGDGTGWSGYGGDYCQNTNNNAIAFESTGYGNGTLIGRYQNLKVQAKGDSTTTTGASIYMAYYDDNTTNKNLIFRTFKIGQNSSWTNRLKDGYSNMPEENTSNRISVASSASKYFDYVITSDKVVVFVYYDLNAARLKLVYSSGPIDGSSINPSVTWKESSVTFPDYVGNYISLAIDSANHIHIAAYDASESNLVYMYLPSYNSTSLTSVTVDQAASVGNWTQIKVRNNVPYIAYYNATETGSRDSIKLAYADAAAGSVQAGVDDDGYTTGHWEYMTVPAITPPQGGDSKFKQVNLDFDSNGLPVVGYLGTNLEFGKWMTE